MPRPELFPPNLDPNLVDRLTVIGEYVLYCSETRRDYRAAIAEFNALCHGNYDVADFDGAAGSMKMRDFAEHALTPCCPKIADLYDAELLEVITWLTEGKGTERETTYWLQLLNVNIPTNRISEIIFGTDLPPIRILAEARTFPPIE